MAKKKRYHQSVKDRMAESRGMERYETAKKFKDREEYAGYKERMKMEDRDGGMIHEDYSAPSNFPQKSFIKYYPECPAPSYHLDDTIAGIDHQRYEDSDKRKENRYKTGKFPSKY